MKRKIRVLMVEDSIFYREYLSGVIESDDALEVAGCATTGKEARALADALKPDVITLDLSLPDVSKFELLEDLVRDFMIPIIVVSSLPEACETALKIGACDYIEKLRANDERTDDQFELLLKLKLKTQAKATTADVFDKSDARVLKAPLKRENATIAKELRVIAIGASLGGTEVVSRILQKLPPSLPGIVIVQHMPQNFTKAYAIRLDKNSAISVSEAENGAYVLPGRALIAPGGRQLTLVKSQEGYRVRLGGSEKYGGFCPSVDVMFSSVAACVGSGAIGVILTGMGRDGAQGIKEMRDRGAFTMGQDKQSCAVFGMPAAALALGGIDVMLPPDEIARELIRLAQ